MGLEKRFRDRNPCSHIRKVREVRGNAAANHAKKRFNALVRNIARERLGRGKTDEVAFEEFVVGDFATAEGILREWYPLEGEIQRVSQINRNKSDWQTLADSVETEKTDEVKEVRWVAAYIHADPTAIPEGSPPSKAAVGMLQWAQGAKGEFFKNVYPRVMPTKKDIDERINRERSGEDTLGLLERVEAAAANASMSDLGSASEESDEEPQERPSDL